MGGVGVPAQVVLVGGGLLLGGLVPGGEEGRVVEEGEVKGEERGATPAPGLGVRRGFCLRMDGIG